jgi:hypothetical protein
MKKKTVQWYKGSQSLRQALSSGIEFSFASGDNKQISPFAYCKDYLQDAVQGHIWNKKRTIYGFTYDPKKHGPVYLRKTKLLVANSSDGRLRDKIPNCLEFLNQIESELKISKTIVFECENPPNCYIRGGVWLFEGSCRWLKSPPMLSLYTLLIRLGFGHEVGKPFMDTINGIINGDIMPYQTVDSSRLSQAKQGLDRILREGDRKIFSRKIQDNYPQHIRINTMHNHLGIIGFSQGVTKTIIPKWHKSEV